MENYISHSEKQTRDVASQLAQHLKAGDIVNLVGDLGAGKTTFVKGLASGSKIRPEEVSSPTFVLMNIYEASTPIYHFDLYRLEGTEDMRQMGFDEFFYGEGIAVIEWAERLGELMPPAYLRVEIKHQGESERAISIYGVGQRYERIAESMQKGMMA